MLRKTKMAVAAVLLTLSVNGALVACSGDEASDKAESSAKSQSKDKGKEKASDQEAVDPDNVSPPLKAVPEVRKAKGAIKDLTLGDCETDPGRQSITGRIKASAKKPTDYLVTVSWTTPAGDVMGRGFAVLDDVAPGSTQEFTIKAKIKDGATQCVPGVTYGIIG
ncbi:MAG: hypothetical protein ACRCYQ_07010 [Nocardioides sp.]